MPATAGSEPESLGALIARVRTAHGKSQLRLAEVLCAAAGTSTVTRHEVSRWEREIRLPTAYWLGWLAMVLDVPLDELERAVAVSRQRRGHTARDVHSRQPAARVRSSRRPA